MESVISSATDVAAWITERERVRTLRMQRHFFVGTTAAVLLAFMSPLTESLGEFALLLILVGIVVRSAARGTDAKLGYLWGWLYAEPRTTTALDRFVDRLIEHARLPARTAGQLHENRVRPLDPFDD